MGLGEGGSGSNSRLSAWEYKKGLVNVDFLKGEWVSEDGAGYGVRYVCLRGRGGGVGRV